MCSCVSGPEDIDRQIDSAIWIDIGNIFICRLSGATNIEERLLRFYYNYTTLVHCRPCR